MNHMKTILSILSVLALILGATLADASRLDIAVWVNAAMVAAMFGLALNDHGRPARSRAVAR
jgi:hypothetical protein